MAWNKREHKRKFMEMTGIRAERGRPVATPLHFWAEWEAESTATEISNPVLCGPRFIHRPGYRIPKSYKGLMNTDPFVFGGFFYAGCQQIANQRPTQLRYLKRGSVILFGSCVSGKFAIDTVFVIDRWVEHRARDVSRLKTQVPKGYFDVTLRPWYECKNKQGRCCVDPDESCRLYFGATVDRPVNGMFSYFPCMTAAQSEKGFPRPTVSIKSVITDNLLQGKKLNRCISTELVKRHWDDVRRQVESQGLSIGVGADMPPMHY